jgi:hypothetical protein
MSTDVKLEGHLTEASTMKVQLTQSSSSVDDLTMKITSINNEKRYLQDLLQRKQLENDEMKGGSYAPL